jgi:hypothetical protein
MKERKKEGKKERSEGGKKERRTGIVFFRIFSFHSRKKKLFLFSCIPSHTSNTI